MKARWKRTLKTALLAATVAFGAALPAQAGYYLPTLDPAYGPIANLGWRATGKLYVPDACEVAIGTGPYVLTLSGPVPDASCSLSTLDLVKVEFYNIGNPLTVIETLNIGTYLADSGVANVVNDLTQELLEITYAGGDAIGLKTSLSNPAIQATNGLVSPPSYFSLNFDSTNGRLVEYGVPNPASFSPNKSISTVAAKFTITRIPEPATLALTLAGLLAVGAARRRRR